MNRRWLALATSLGIFGVDRWTKWLIESRFDFFDTTAVIPGFFNLVRSENPGVAFGIFSDTVSHNRTLALVSVSLIALVVMASLLWKIDKQDRHSAAGKVDTFIRFSPVEVRCRTIQARSGYSGSIHPIVPFPP